MTVQPMPTNFTALDLFVWHEEGSLELSPKFQRRSVWKPAARSFFIDTLLRGFPVPPLHIRMVPGAVGERPHREVIDGQQRLRTLFDFMSGKLSITRGLHSPWSGKTIETISDEERERLRLAQFHVYQYQAIDDATVLEIFSRLNTYSVALTPQELRNGRYFGEFKTLVYELARQYLEFWRSGRVFSEASIARMAEAEFVSELLVLQFDGLQDKKTTLDVFYAGLDQDWPTDPIQLPGRRGKVFTPKAWLSRDESEKRFKETMSAMVDATGDLIAHSAFRRVPLLYTLYSVVFHALYGLPGIQFETPRRHLQKTENVRLRAAVEELASVLSSDSTDEAIPAWQRDFVSAASRQTDNVGPRRDRFETLWRLTAIT
jgi:hypothetical protein